MRGGERWRLPRKPSLELASGTRSGVQTRSRGSGVPGHRASVRRSHRASVRRFVIRAYGPTGARMTNLSAVVASSLNGASRRQSRRVACGLLGYETISSNTAPDDTVVPTEATMFAITPSL